MPAEVKENGFKKSCLPNIIGANEEVYGAEPVNRQLPKAAKVLYGKGLEHLFCPSCEMREFMTWIRI